MYECVNGVRTDVAGYATHPKQSGVPHP